MESIQNIFQKLKGKPALLQKYGIQPHYQFICALPTIFDFSSQRSLYDIKSHRTFIDKAIKTCYSSFLRINSNMRINQVKSLMRPHWPLLIRQIQATKQIEHLEYIKAQINLTHQDMCFIMYYNQLQPLKYNQYFVTETLKNFQVARDKINYTKLLNVIVGKNCIQSFFIIKKMFNPIYELQKYQDWDNSERVSSLTNILNKMLINKRQIIQLINKIGFGKQCQLMKVLDQWINTDSFPHQNLSLFRLLKIICLLECMYQMQISKNENKKMNNIVSCIIKQCSKRILNRLFNKQNFYENAVLLNWFEGSKIWGELILSEDFKHVFPSFIPVFYQLTSLSNQQFYGKTKNQQQILKNSQNELIYRYLAKIKLKYFSYEKFMNWSPKFYKFFPFKLYSILFTEDYERQVLLSKQGTGTISMSKIKINPQTDAQQLKKQSFISSNKQKKTSLQFNQLNRCLNICLKNIQMHNIYVICSLMQIQINKKSKSNDEVSIKQFETIKNTLSTIFYKILKAIQIYKQKIKQNVLIKQIQKQILQFAIYFSIQKSVQREFQPNIIPDLLLVADNQVNLENIQQQILKNSINFSLSTIYQIKYSQKEYKNYIYSQNNKKQNDKKQNEFQINQKRQSTFKIIIDKLKPSLIYCLYKIFMILRKKCSKAQSNFILDLLKIDDEKLTQILYTNLIFYTYHKCNKGNGLSMLQQDLKDIISLYFQKENQGQKQLGIMRIIANARKSLQKFNSYSGNRNSNSNTNQRKSVHKINQQNSISFYYWKVFCNTALKKQKFYQYAKNLQKLNCVKESIYFIQLHHRIVKKNNYTPQQAKHLFKLCSRLDSHLQVCRPFVQNLIVQNTFNSEYHNIQVKNNDNQDITKLKKQQKNHQEDHISSIIHNINIETLISTNKHSLTKINQLQNVEQINSILQQIQLSSTFYQALRTQNYQIIIKKLQKIKKKDLCLGIVQGLKKLKYECLEQIGDKYSDDLKRKIIIYQSIIYNQLLYFEQYDDLAKELFAINVQMMSIEQNRAATILSYCLQDYEQTLLYYNKLLQKTICSKANKLQIRKIYVQELEIYKLAAQYKSICGFPSSQMIASFQLIVEKIVDLTPQNINKKTTQPLFQALKFIFDNYTNLTFQQENFILKKLNKYLKKVDQIKNIQLSIEATYFILRLILMESKNTNTLLKIKDVFPFQKYHPSLIEPHKHLLIDYIGNSQPQNQLKNQFVSDMLFYIAQNDPIFSSWWLHSMIYHCKYENKKEKDTHYNSVDKNIQKIGLSIFKKLQQASIKLGDYIKWINELSQLNEKQQKIKYPPIPEKLTSPFSTQLQLLEIVSVSPIGQGKSKPIQIQIKAKTKNKQIKYMKFIKKFIKDGKCGFKTESATANFIKDCQLLDEGVTYSIMHLNKYCIFIQYIDHENTLRELMMSSKKTPTTQKYSYAIFLQQRKKILNEQKILGNIYDEYALKLSCTNFTLYDFFLISGVDVIQSWWNKYINFIRTYAQWSYLCYLIGIGDRHLSNILVTSQGKVVHIDFEYIFDTGRLQPCPEWVPFRCTKNLNGQLSIIQPYGIMFSEFIKISQLAKQKYREIWRAQSHFSYLKYKNINFTISKKIEAKNLYQQTLNLFKKATSKVFLRDMFFGWGSQF